MELKTLDSPALLAAVSPISSLAKASAGPWTPADSPDLRIVHDAFCESLGVPADSPAEFRVDRRGVGRGASEEIEYGDLAAGLLFLSEPKGGAARFPKLRPVKGNT